MYAARVQKCRKNFKLLLEKPIIYDGRTAHQTMERANYVDNLFHYTQSYAYALFVHGDRIHLKQNKYPAKRGGKGHGQAADVGFCSRAQLHHDGNLLHDTIPAHPRHERAVRLTRSRAGGGHRHSALPPFCQVERPRARCLSIRPRLCQSGLRGRSRAGRLYGNDLAHAVRADHSHILHVNGAALRPPGI